jgi:hypothetical protein
LERNAFLSANKVALRAAFCPMPESRVARWYILKPQIPILVNFGGPWNGKS